MGSCLSTESGEGSKSFTVPSPPCSGSPGLGSKKAKRIGRKRQGPSMRSSFESTLEEDQIHRIPGRLFLNGATKQASLFTKQGKKGTNQDAMVVWENFGSKTDTVFCGVFDGHGPFGHLVARRVRDCLSLKLNAHWEAILEGEELSSISTTKSMASEETTSIFLGDDFKASIDFEEEKLPEIFTILKESFLKAFKVTDKELKLYQNIDCFCSGTTAVTLVKQGQNLIIGNVGDSRAVLGTRDQNDSLVAVQLTVDLKPNLPSEAERIKQYRGRVFALHDEPEIARIWLPNNDSPGLAMARAFGDFCLKDFGLISVPEISFRHITDKDEFIILATDGVWDVLSNQDAVDIVASAATRSSASRTLVEHAIRLWKFRYPTSKVDDCAAVCLFLNVTDDANKAEEPSTSSSPSLREEAIPSGSPAAVESENWSALEGVTRTNTLMTLPRFVVDGGKSRQIK